jgi:EB1-like C-terminal motif
VPVRKLSSGENLQERDFYFSKLREIELLCQQEGVKEQWDVMQHVENVLYAATEEEGTQARLAALEALGIGSGSGMHVGTPELNSRT